jgi:hypothetical protein
MIRELALRLFIPVAAACFVLNGCSDRGGFIDRGAGEDYLVGNEDGSNGSEAPNSEVPSLRSAVDRFQQLEKTKLDVLWVIDNSASMSPYQQQLADNIGEFLDGAARWNVDIQMGVTSTDMCQAKRPQDLAKVYCPDKPETRPGLAGRLHRGHVVRGLDQSARDVFADLAMIGTNGSSFEHGLSSAKAAIELSLAGSNGGLVRRDAFLSIVIVSDEEDDGVGLSKPDEKDVVWTDTGWTTHRFTAEDLLKYLAKVKTDGSFSVSSVTGFKPGGSVAGGCYDGGSLEFGAEQAKASDLSGGVKLDICADEWATGLSSMANNLAAQLNTFKLSHVPRTPSTIQVFVNGAIMTSGWHYIEQRRSVVFDIGRVPPYGAQITIKYNY